MATGYKVMVQLDDWDHSIVEYDGCIYSDIIDAVRVCKEADEYLDAFLDEVDLEPLSEIGEAICNIF